MKTFVLATLIWGTAALGFAQTHDDCRPGAFHHAPQSSLGHDVLIAAYHASFIGYFHREPTWERGKGVDDGNYWIGKADHYGEYSDAECRAGWNRYTELQLWCNGCSQDPRLGDQPAQFQPESAPPVVVIPPAPVPLPAPLPSAPTCDPSQLTRIEQKVDAIALDLHEHRVAEQTAWASVRHFFAAQWPTIVAGLGGFLAGTR